MMKRGLTLQKVVDNQRKKLKNLTFERLYIYDEGFVIVGNRDGTGDWFANNIPSRCFRVSDVLSERTIQ